MANLNFKQVEEVHGSEAKAVWDDVCRIGGHGLVSPNFDGGISLKGLRATQKSAIVERLGFDPFAGDEDEAPDADAPAIDAESLAKGKTREQLEAMAHAAGLDGNRYTNKTELAEAILAKQAEKAEEAKN